MATALVTGGSSGIGLELARRFARGGYDVLLVARSADALGRAAAELSGAHGVRATPIAADLSETRGLSEIADAARHHGPVDVLVNSAGVGLYGEFQHTSLERELAMIRLNVEALVALTKLVLPDMLERRRGRVANLSSTAAFQAGPTMAVYYATKAFVLSFSEALAHEVAGTGVTVTAVCPGPTPTGFQRASGVERQRMLQTPLLMPVGRVADIAYRGIMRGKRVVVPGIANRLLALGAQLGPRRLATAVAGFVSGKVR